MLRIVPLDASVSSLVGLAVAPATARTSTVPGLKSAADCTAEYEANKGALKDARARKGEFITA